MSCPVDEFVAPPAKEFMTPSVNYDSCQLGILMSRSIWLPLLTSAVPMPYCAAVPPVCKSDPAVLGTGTMSVKTTSQGVLQYEDWT